MSIDEDAVQRALNETKKRELREQFGAEFHSGQRELPPEIEGRWLREIEEFERKFAGAGEITVRAFIGNPPVLPLGAIPSDELQSALEGLLEILRSNDIEIVFGRSVSPAEAYRFLTEEILGEKIADVRIEGLTLQFLYDEYHPDPAEEAATAAGVFFHALAERNERLVREALSTREALNESGDPCLPEYLHANLVAFLNATATFLGFEAEISAVEIAGDRARVTADLSWAALSADQLQRTAASGKAVLLLKENVDRWEIIQAILPGAHSTLPCP